MTYALATDFALIERALIAWAKATTGLPVIWAKQIAGRPHTPYLTLRITSDGRNEGQDSEQMEYNTTTGKLDTVTYGPRMMTVELTGYSETQSAAGQAGARQYVLQAVAGLRASRIYGEILRPSGLGFLKQLSDVLDIGEQLGDRWEARFQVDLEFGYTLAFTDKSTAEEGTTYIETVQPTVMIYP